jgi:hypothetical protein
MIDRQTGIRNIVLLSLIVLSMSSVAFAADMVIMANSTQIGNIVFVSPKAGDTASANGAALLAALAGITDATSTNKYLIKLGPGTFDLNTNSLTTKDYVDLEGSGKELTVITSNVNAAGTIHASAVRGSISKMGVNNTSTGTVACAIYNDAGLLFIEDVAIDARYGSSYNIGIWNSDSSLQLKYSSIVALSPSGYAIYNSGSQYNNIIVTNTILTGSTYQVTNVAGYDVSIAFSRLGGSSSGSG